MTSPRLSALSSYGAVLAEYASTGSEDALANAYGLGRRMLEARVEILDVVTEHAEVLQRVLEELRGEEHPAIHERAIEFQREAIAPFAMVIQGYDETIGLLQQRVAQLQTLDDMKNDFIAMIVHDMKNPLAGARSLAEILVSRWDVVEDAQRREICDSILECAESAMRLVNDVLDLSRLEHDASKLSCQGCDMAGIAGDVARKLGSTSDGDRVEVLVGASVPSAWADPDRQRQVLENLVSNALKFSPANSPVKIEIERVSGDLIEIRVTDQGAGIAVEDHPRLFQRFSRITTPGYEEIPGSGIGLYASKRIIEGHGGSFRVRSEPGMGSCFSYTVPTAAFGRRFLAADGTRPT